MPRTSNNIDVYRAAQILIRDYKNGAEDYSTQMLFRFLKERDEPAVQLWKRIIQALKELRNTTPPSNLNG